MTSKQDSPADCEDTVGGWLCLDFVNTLSWRGRKHSEEHLNTYTDLVSWSQRVHILTTNQAKRLVQAANHYPSEAEGVLNRAIKLREAIYQVFSAITSHSASENADLETLNMEFSKAMAKIQITKTRGRYTLTFRPDEESFDCMLWPIARSVADLLTSDRLGRVRKCAAEDCGWLFLDQSRNQSRRWCDMNDCGNRAKARRHYRRKRADRATIT